MNVLDRLLDGTIPTGVGGNIALLPVVVACVVAGAATEPLGGRVGRRVLVRGRRLSAPAAPAHPRTTRTLCQGAVR